MSFEELYGQLGKGFIEVHHKRPLSTLDEKMEVDPVEDLVCVCANCHRMIHRKKNAIMSVEELRSIVRSKGSTIGMCQT